MLLILQGGEDQEEMCEADLGRAAEIPAFIQLLRAPRWVMARSPGGDVCPKGANRLFLVALYGLWATPLGFGVKDIFRRPKCFKIGTRSVAPL